MLRAFEDPTVLEIGAHMGEEWGDLCSYAKHVWAVEPSPDKHAHLRKVQAELKDCDVNLFPIGVSSTTGVLKFWVDGQGSQQNTVGRPPPWVSQTEFEAKAIRVNVSTVDQFWRTELQGKHITMLKIDTQGHEPAIINGSRELLREDPPDIIHMEFSPGLMRAASLDGVATLHFLYSMGYMCFDCEAFGPPPVEPKMRSFKEFEKSFGSFVFKGAQHGQWADLVCLI